MFNIALSWALLISKLTTTSSTYLAVYFTAAFSQVVSPVIISLAINLAILWFLAILFYLVLRMPRLRAFLKPNRQILILLGIGNFILVLGSILSVFGMSGIGGGASVGVILVLFSFGNLLAIPCWLALAGGNIWLLVRSIAPGAPGASPSQSAGPPSKAGLVIALIMLVLPFAYLGWLYQSVAGDLKKISLERQAKNARFEELCKAVRIDIYKMPPDPRSLYFPESEDLETGWLDYVDFIEVKRDPRVVKQGEAEYTRYTRVKGQKAFSNGKLNAVTIPVQEPQAALEMVRHAVTSAEDRAKGFYVEETSIVDRRTGEPIALFSKAEVLGGNTVEYEKYFCPREFDHINYKGQATLFALGLLDQEKTARFSEALKKFQEGRPVMPQGESKPAAQ